MSFRPRLSVVVLVMGMAVASCATGHPHARSAAAQSSLLDVVAQGPLRAELAKPLAVQRADMVARIRADVSAAAPSAAGPALERALAVEARLPREEFVQPAGRKLAYVDLPQDIGFGQTISDPYIVAIMTAALDLPPDATVLDVGTGSGYQAAVLSPLARQVWSIEIVDPLARSAAARLRRLGYRNVEVRSGDGYAGWPEHAPFDAIVVAAGAAAIPTPLLDQLKPGGRLVMPIGPSFASEQILVVTKQPDGWTTRCSLGPAMFVDLTGRGQAPAGTRGLLDRTIPLCHGAPVT